MTRRALLILAVILTIAADKPKPDAITSDRDKLQGAWQVVSIESDGKKEPAEFSRAFTYTFTGDRVRFLGNETTPGADLELSYTLDSKKDPKEIDLKFTKTSDSKGIGSTMQGIYSLEGDELRLCYSDKARPTTFDTKGKEHTVLVILKRKK